MKSRRVEIEHAPGFRSTALLLVGWLAAQLQWESGGEDRTIIVRLRERVDGSAISVTLREKQGEPISRCCQLATGRQNSGSRTAKGADLLDVSSAATAGRKMQQLLPAGKNDLVKLGAGRIDARRSARVYLRAFVANGAVALSRGEPADLGELGLSAETCASCSSSGSFNRAS